MSAWLFVGIVVAGTALFIAVMEFWERWNAIVDRHERTLEENRRYFAAIQETRAEIARRHKGLDELGKRIMDAADEDDPEQTG